MNHMEVKTEKGLKYFGYGFLLYIIAMVVLLILLIALIGVISELIADPDTISDEQSDEALGTILGVIGGLCVAILIIVIALIMGIVGLISINSGKEEFGQKHSDSVQRGTILLIVGFLIGMFGGLGGTIIGQVTGVFAAILIAFGFLYLVIEISDDKGKNMLWIAAIVYIIIAIISAAVTIWLYTSTGLADIQTDATTEEQAALADDVVALMVISMGIGSLGLIPFIIFFFAYKRAQMRIINKEIQPTLPTYAPPYPGAYPPQYPYPPGYPPQHPYPPGAPPPPSGAPPTGVAPAAIQTKHCLYCGTQIPREAAVCPACGKGKGQ